MSKQQPFTWVVKFTVSPTWVADGFALCDERAHSMLATEIGGAYNTEISAQVLETPWVLDIAAVRGYTAGAAGVKQVIWDLKAGTPHAGKLHAALIAARDALEESINAASSKNTIQRRGLKLVREALALIDSRQGEPEDVE